MLEPWQVLKLSLLLSKLLHLLLCSNELFLLIDLVMLCSQTCFAGRLDHIEMLLSFISLLYLLLILLVLMALK